MNTKASSNVILSKSENFNGQEMNVEVTFKNLLTKKTITVMRQYSRSFNCATSKAQSTVVIKDNDDDNIENCQTHTNCSKAFIQTQLKAVINVDINRFGNYNTKFYLIIYYSKFLFYTL